MKINDDQYSELCDLFEQAWRHERPVNEDPARIHSTSDEARAFANAAMRVLDYEHTPIEDPEVLARLAAYYLKHHPVVG